MRQLANQWGPDGPSDGSARPDPNSEHHFFEQVFELLTLLWWQEQTPGPPASPGPASKSAEALEFVRFLDEIPGGFLIYRAKGREEILYANKGMLRIMGCGTAAEFRQCTHNSFRGLVLAEDLEAVEESIAQQIAASQYDLDYVEYRVRRRDGQIRWLEDYGHFVQTQALGGLFYVFIGDATEKRARRRLEQEQSLKSLSETYDRERALINQEYLRRLEVIEGLSVNYESIFYLDLAQDRILPYRLSSRTQPNFEARFQARRYTAFVREYIGQWVCPEDRDLVARMTDPAYIRDKLDNCISYYVNYRVLAENTTQYLQLRIARVGSDSGVQAVMGCRRVDDEVRREMEQKQVLAEALSNANLAMAAKNTFLSNMSHDMRTPLNAILGFIELARRSEGDPAALARYLDQVEASGRQLLGQINQVLELSHAQSGSEKLANIPCDLCGLAREVYEFLQPQAVEKGIAFELDCGGIRHSAVYADSEKLHQLILYLANNAITYTNAGQVRITLSEAEQLPNRYGVYRLVAEDTGIGIGKEFLGRIFDSFAREKNTTLSGIHGIGLGLTIVKNIVDMLDGSIAVESEVGKGSVFTVEVRLRQDLPEEPVGGGGFLGDSRCQRLLLVEDNELNREIETELLQEAGFVIETAVDGRQAVERMLAAGPQELDLILMDLQMPVMDGWTAVRTIRAMPDPERALIPIIALSANTMPEDLRRSREAGMDAHLQKPVDIPLLLETIREVMHSRPAGRMAPSPAQKSERPVDPGSAEPGQ